MKTISRRDVLAVAGAAPLAAQTLEAPAAQTGNGLNLITICVDTWGANYYGCYGCHEIPGFEAAQKIGTELSEEGSKLVDIERESRLGGPSTIVLTFSKAVVPVDGVLSANEFVLINGTFSSATLSGSTITLQLTGLTDRTLVTVNVQGVANTSGVVITGDTDLSVRSLYGDVTQNGTVSTGDLQAVKNALLKTLTSANFLCDVNVSGAVTTGDLQAVKNNLLHTLSASLFSSTPIGSAGTVNPLLA